MQELQTVVTAGAIILNRKNEVLLQLRDDPQFAGRWATIGGYVEERDVNIEDAIRREILEEIGCELDLKFFSKYIQLQDNIRVINHFFWGYIDDDQEINLKEGKGAKFFSIEQIKKMKLILNSDFLLFRFFRLALNFDLKWQDFDQP